MSTEGSGASRASDELHNEDAFLVEEGLGLYAVCDGLSDRPAGEVAADVAVAALEQFFAVAAAEHGRSLDDLGERESVELVEQGVRAAMRAVLAAALEDARLDGMATTVTLLLAHRDLAVVGHTGHSRAVLIRGGRALALTKHHAVAEVMRDRDELEDESAIPIDTFAVLMRSGDTFVLCTHGAERIATDPAIVRAAGDSSPRMLASRIVSEANRRDAHHDATAVVVRVRSEGERAWLALSRPPRESDFGHALAFPVNHPRARAASRRTRS